MIKLVPLVPIITNGIEPVYVMYLNFVLICISSIHLDDIGLAS